MMHRIFIGITTVAVCVAGFLLYGRFVGPLFTDAVSTQQVILHAAIEAGYGFLLGHVMARRLTFGPFLLQLLPAILLSSLLKMANDIPATEASFLRDITLIFGAVLVRAILLRFFPAPAPAPEEPS
jgi:hypothetical protein